MANVVPIAVAAKAGKSIVETVDGVYDLGKKIYTDTSGTLEGATEFKDRHRSLELTIVNGINRDLEFENGSDYFNSGTWYTSLQPLVIKPGTAALGFVANRQGSILTGVTGGLRLGIKGKDYALFLGFTNPQFGCYKTSIHVWPKTRSAEDAYLAASDDSIKCCTEHGYFLRATLEQPKEGGMKRMEYVISKAK